jgi:hypothetical protein
VCVPVDSMLWPLVSYRATRDDLRALLGTGCSRERAQEVLEREGASHPGAPFGVALEVLATTEP